MREDEKSVFQVIATHPNFVKTYLVVNKTDGDYKNLIFMEKCGLYFIFLTFLKFFFSTLCILTNGYFHVQICHCKRIWIDCESLVTFWTAMKLCTTGHKCWML